MIIMILFKCNLLLTLTVSNFDDRGVGGGMRSETEKMTNKRKTETEKMTDKRKKEKEMKTERR